VTKLMTLEPGDVILTGTPAGVGMARKPPRWLRDGDEKTPCRRGGKRSSPCRAFRCEAPPRRRARPARRLQQSGNDLTQRRHKPAPLPVSATAVLPLARRASPGAIVRRQFQGFANAQASASRSRRSAQRLLQPHFGDASYARNAGRQNHIRLALQRPASPNPPRCSSTSSVWCGPLNRKRRRLPASTRSPAAAGSLPARGGPRAGHAGDRRTLRGRCLKSAAPRPFSRGNNSASCGGDSPTRHRRHAHDEGRRSSGRADAFWAAYRGVSTRATPPARRAGLVL
jgi:hypothetical protein